MTQEIQDKKQTGAVESVTGAPVTDDVKTDADDTKPQQTRRCDRVEFGDVKTVITMLGICRTSLYKICKEDATFPPRLNFGGAVRWSLADVRKWARAQAVNGGQYA